jgi:hypothetical protein
MQTDPPRYDAACWQIFINDRLLLLLLFVLQVHGQGA